jgi:hypothetical protein
MNKVIKENKRNMNSQISDKKNQFICRFYNFIDWMDIKVNLFGEVTEVQSWWIMRQVMHEAGSFSIDSVATYTYIKDNQRIHEDYCNFKKYYCNLTKPNEYKNVKNVEPVDFLQLEQRIVWIESASNKGFEKLKVFGKHEMNMEILPEEKLEEWMRKNHDPISGKFHLLTMSKPPTEA